MKQPVVPTAMSVKKSIAKPMVTPLKATSIAKPMTAKPAVNKMPITASAVKPVSKPAPAMATPLLAPKPAVISKPAVMSKPTPVKAAPMAQSMDIVGPTANPSPLRNVNAGMRDMSPQKSTIAEMPKPMAAPTAESVM